MPGRVSSVDRIAVCIQIFMQRHRLADVALITIHRPKPPCARVHVARPQVVHLQACVELLSGVQHRRCGTALAVCGEPDGDTIGVEIISIRNNSRFIRQQPRGSVPVIHQLPDAAARRLRQHVVTKRVRNIQRAAGAELFEDLRVAGVVHRVQQELLVGALRRAAVNAGR